MVQYIVYAVFFLFGYLVSWLVLHTRYDWDKRTFTKWDDVTVAEAKYWRRFNERKMYFLSLGFSPNLAYDYAFDALQKEAKAALAENI